LKYLSRPTARLMDFSTASSSLGGSEDSEDKSDEDIFALQSVEMLVAGGVLGGQKGARRKICGSYDKRELFLRVGSF
jgi:hypothetical protein